MKDIIYRFDWHTLNLERGEISETLGTMPPETRHACYTCRCLAQPGLRHPAPWIPVVLTGELKNSTLMTAFCFDFEHLDHGWKVGPAAVAAKRKIHALGDLHWTPLGIWI
ncbi:hypothetical protein V6N13_065419 [Hibiscus sabdariffa]|uniref:Uncharacterized protein n=2 Tax=Hibiscus sabdariffa TaxID=183260 RepID=A0ABR1ZLT7_9ROSI